VALDTAEFVVFGFFPEVVAFLDNTRVSQNVAIATEQLWLGDLRWRELEFELRFLFLRWRRTN
jgi:hypothetical protein